MIYIVTGKLGAGKSLLAVQKAIDYACEGRRVAANFHIDYAPICQKPGTKISQVPVTVLPSIPKVANLMALGQGGDFEDTAGGLFLDECAQFLNARNWQGQEREQLINWLLHARKRRWDVFLIVQHERMLDKQVCDALAEYVVTIKRTDRLNFPFLPVKLPRMHIGTVRYGLDLNAPVADRWITRGSLPMQCYDTTQIFNDEDDAAYTVLPASYSKFLNAPKAPTLIQRLTGLRRQAKPAVVGKEPPPLIQYLRSKHHADALEMYRAWQYLHSLDADLAYRYLSHSLKFENLCKRFTGLPNFPLVSFAGAI